MPPKSWQFVSVGEGGQNRGDESRRIVRGNAMRDFRRSERLARMRDYQEIQAQSSSGAEHEDAGTYQAHVRYVAQEPVPWDSPGVEELVDLTGEPGLSFDPFISTVLPDNQDAQRLFSHFVHRIAPQLQPLSGSWNLNSINHFFARQALSDEGLLSSILFHAGLHHDTFSGRNWSQSTLHFEGEAVRLLNSRLESTDDAVSDSSIAMVGFLAASGNITGNVATDMAHTQALQTMVRMRGGLENLGWDGALAMLLSVGDLISATISNSPPRLEAPDISTNPLLAELPSSFLRPLATGDDSASFGSRIQLLLDAISHLAALQIKLLDDPAITQTSVMALTQLSSAVEHRLLSIQAPMTPPQSSVDSDILLHEACRLVLLIIMSSLFRNFRPHSATLRSLQTRLTQAISSLDAQQDTFPSDQSHQRIFLWVLWIGGMSSMNQEWYATRIRDLIRELRIVDIGGLRSCFEQFVWSPRMENVLCYELVERVLSKQGGGWVEESVSEVS